MKTWRQHQCLNELKVTRHYWVLSKTKLFYGWLILLFFILLKKKRWNFLCVIYIMEYWISAIGRDMSCHQSQFFFLKLNSTHKWTNCCNKSINVGVFTAGIVCIIYFNCFVVYLALLSTFLFWLVISCHQAQPNLKPKRTTECSNMFWS